MHFSKLELRRLLPVAMLALAVSCRPAKMTGEGTVLIDSFSTKTNASFFQDVYSGFRVVPLQTGDIALGASGGLRLKDEGGKYILTDAEANAIYTFDHSGKLLGRIMKVGRGPGEYMQLAACEYHDGKYIALVDGGRVIEYDGQGELIREIAQEHDLMDLAIVEGQPVLLVSRVDGDPAEVSDKILVCDADYRPVSSFCPQGFQIFNYASSLVPVVGEPGTFLYLEPVSTQLHKCNKDGIISSYVLDLKGKSVPEAILRADDFEEILALMMNNTPDMYCCSRVFENGSHLLLNLEYVSNGVESLRGQWLVDKRDGSSRIEYLDYNGEFFGFLGLPQLLTAQDEVVYIVDSELLDAALADAPALAAVKDALAAAAGGPALLFCKIKD